MTEQAKKFTWLVLLLIVTAAELAWIWFEATDYARINPFNIFWIIPWVVYFFLIVLLVVDYSNKFFLYVCYASIAVLVLNPVFLQWTKPEYRYMDAVSIIHKAENIPVSNGYDRKVKTMELYDELPYQQYLITGMKDDQVVQFLFDPYNGEYFLLDDSSPYP